MDCPSEENLIRIKLDGLEDIRHLDFDIENRKLFVFHSAGNPEITERLESLKLGANLLKTEKVAESEMNTENTASQTKLLWTVLLINFGFLFLN